MTRLVPARIVPRLEAALRTRLSRYFLDSRRRLEPFLLRSTFPTPAKARDAGLLDAVDVVLRTFAWDAEARILRMILRPAYAVASDEAVAAVGSEIGLGVSYDLNARQLSRIEAELGRRIVAITDRSRELVGGRIVDGIEKGLSVRDIVLGVGPGASDGRGGTKPAFDGIRGLVDGWASTGSGGRGILGPVESAADRMARRAPPLRSTRAFLIAQTETGNAFNRSAIESYRASGLVDFVEVFDGPDCGWSQHNDPDLAHGSIRKLEDAGRHALSHPRCQRAFGASLGSTSAKPSPSQGRAPTDVPGATPGLRPDDTQPFGGRTVPTSPSRSAPAPAPNGGTSLEALLEAASDRIRFDEVETAIVFDDEGRVLLDKSEGHRSRVNFTSDEVEAVNGGTLTHNHPGATNDPRLLTSTAFSPDDAQLLLSGKLREIRAVGRGADHRLSIDLSYDPDQLRAVLSALDQEVRLDFTAAIGRGDMSIVDAETTHWHEVWTRFASREPRIRYSRTLRPDRASRS